MYSVQLMTYVHCKNCYEVYNMFTIQCCMKIKNWVWQKEIHIFHIGN